jgi:protein-S-isoprenylcysteine O-methyltransferase Ste14
MLYASFLRTPISESTTLVAIFWSAFILWIVPELVASKLRRSSGSAETHDKGSLNLVAILWFAGIALDFIFTIYLPGAATGGNRKVTFAAGIIVMLASVAFRWYSAFLLGKYFTFDVALHGDQQLIQTGPYRYVRHPSYTGALFTLIGFGLALGNWLAVFAGTFCLGVAYVYRIRIEEAALLAGLGGTYSEYANHTWRLLPFLF